MVLVQHHKILNGIVNDINTVSCPIIFDSTNIDPRHTGCTQRPQSVGVTVKIGIFLLLEALKLLGGLVYHVTSLRVRSTVIYGNTIELTVHTSCYWVLDLLCVTFLALQSTSTFGHQFETPPNLFHYTHIFVATAKQI